MFELKSWPHHLPAGNPLETEAPRPRLEPTVSGSALSQDPQGICCMSATLTLGSFNCNLEDDGYDVTYLTVAFISHASKGMLKIPQARLQ